MLVWIIYIIKSQTIIVDNDGIHANTFNYVFSKRVEDLSSIYSQKPNSTAACWASFK